MKVNCPICGGSKICNIVSQETTDHHNQYGTDSITHAKLRIHNHRKGQNLCNGSQKIIEIDCLEGAEFANQYNFEY